jgi:hypothetical protein
MMCSVLVLWEYLRSLFTKFDPRSNIGAEIEVFSNDVYPTAERHSLEVSKTGRISA